MCKCKALFLDRDGVINVDTGYVHRREDIHFVDGIFTLAATAAKLSYKIIIVTNQAGIGRGYYTENDFHLLMNWVVKQFLAHGVEVNGIYFCPFHPTHGIGIYKKESIFRKPAPGMILQAAWEHNIELSSSLMVGDAETDIIAGHSAGVGTLFYLTVHNCLKFNAYTNLNIVQSLAEITAWLQKM